MPTYLTIFIFSRCLPSIKFFTPSHLPNCNYLNGLIFCLWGHLTLQSLECPSLSSLSSKLLLLLEVSNKAKFLLRSLPDLSLSDWVRTLPFSHCLWNCAHLICVPHFSPSNFFKISKLIVVSTLLKTFFSHYVPITYRIIADHLNSSIKLCVIWVLLTSLVSSLHTWHIPIFFLKDITTTNFF